MAADEFGIDWDAAGSVEQKPDVSSVSVPQHQEPTEDTSGFVKDVLVHGVAGGVEQAVRGTYSTVQAGAELVGAKLPDLGEPIIDEAEGVPAQIVRDVTQFGIGFVGGMNLLRGVRATGATAMVLKEIAASALGTGIVADPNAPRLSNLIQKYPWLENPVTEYLATSDDDSIAESKFKAALEDGITGAAASVLFKSVKALKGAVSGKADDVAKLADEVAEEVKVADAASVQPKASTDGLKWETKELPKDLDLWKAMPGSELDPTIKMAKIDDLVHGHTMETPEAKASMEKYMKAFQDDPTKIPAMVREEMPDGTFQIPSGNGRLAAAKALGMKEVPVVDFRSADTVKAKAAAAAENVKITAPSTGKVIFELTKDEAKAFDAHVDYMVSNGHLEDIFSGPGFTAFNPRRSDATPDTQEVVEALTMYVKPKLDKFMKGEHRTHEQVKAFADLLGEHEHALLGRMQQTVKNMADLDATIVAAKGLTYRMARDVRSLANKVHSGIATAEEQAMLQEGEKRLADIFGMTLAIRKGAARATSAGKIATGEGGGELADSMFKAGEGALKKGDVKELATILSLTKDPKEVIQILKPKSMMGKLIDAHNEVWINGILSGVKTHVVNMTSATVNTLLTPANQIIGGVITRNPAEIREGFALYRGLYRHIFDSLEMAGRAMKTERAVLDPGKSTDEMMEKAISGKNFETLGRFADWMGYAARIPGRFLKAEDEFFKQMNYRAKVEAGAARQAAELVHAGKLDPSKMVEFTTDGKVIKISEVEKFIREKFAAAFSPDQVGLNKNAIEYSREITFTQDLNAIKTHDWFGNPGARIQQFAAGHPWLRGTILPFIKVPTNLMREAGNYTPIVGAFKKEGMDIWKGIEKDPTKRAMFAGKMATGSMMWVGATMLALQGRITGSAFGDKDMRARQMESGWQPYSVVFEKADGTKEYVSFQRLDPYGMVFGLAADVAYLSNHIDENSRNNLALALTTALAKNLSSKSYLQGLVEWSSMLGGGYSAEEQTKRMLQMRAASYLPNALNAITGDDELKELRTTVDAMMAKIPGLSSQVEAKRDYFGEKRVAPMGYPWNAIDPFPVSESKDKVRQELARLSRSQSEAKFTMPDTKLGNVDLTTVRNAKGQTAYDRWTELIGTTTLGGKTFHQKLGDLMQGFRYAEGTDGTSAYHNGNRIVFIKREQEKYREAALREMLHEFDAEHKTGAVKYNLRQMVSADKRNERDVQHGRVDRIRDLLNLNK
jgi:hypothetical protein